MKLSEYLRANKLKAYHLAMTAGVNPSVVSRYLGGGKISPEVAAKISTATGGNVSIQELLYPGGLPEGAKLAGVDR